MWGLTVFERRPECETREFTRMPSWQEAADQARLDWQNALKYFEVVTEEDLIDYAVYSAKAAERKYMYLLKKLKSEYYKGEKGDANNCEHVY